MGIVRYLLVGKISIRLTAEMLFYWIWVWFVIVAFNKRKVLINFQF